MSENFEKKFEDYMKNQELKPEVLGPEDGVFIARFTSRQGGSHVLGEFKTKKEYDAWYERVGAGIIKNYRNRGDEAEITMDFGPAEMNLDAMIARAEKNPADTRKFEDLIKNILTEKELGKEGYVFVCKGKERGEKDFRPLVEFDTADEAWDWYDSYGKWIMEDGGEVTVEYGLPELKK